MVGIGTTSPSQKLEVAGNVAAAGFFYTSDRRYKENISVITDPLQKITQLSGYTFTWKNSGRADIGVIAQEVESVFPQAVSTNTQ
ncbi:MAG: tail fiber domain-containing protein [bacterium]